MLRNRRDVPYADERGRTRWQRNDEIAEKLKQLGDFLIIGGYEDSHATRYGRLAHTISRHPESITTLHREERLGDIPGVGKTIAEIIAELLETGTCRKMEEWAEHKPKSVLELTKIPRMGAKTARRLYQEHGIDSLAVHRNALENGQLEKVEGLGRKSIATIRDFLARHVN